MNTMGCAPSNEIISRGMYFVIINIREYFLWINSLILIDFEVTGRYHYTGSFSYKTNHKFAHISTSQNYSAEDIVPSSKIPSRTISQPFTQLFAEDLHNISNQMSVTAPQFRTFSQSSNRHDDRAFSTLEPIDSKDPVPASLFSVPTSSVSQKSHNVQSDILSPPITPAIQFNTTNVNDIENYYKWSTIDEFGYEFKGVLLEKLFLIQYFTFFN